MLETAAAFPRDGDGDGDGARLAPLPRVPSAASLPHAGEKPATSLPPAGCHPARCHRRGDELPVPCPAMPGAGGHARCRRGSSRGKRAAGCGAQISGCLSSSRCCGRRAGGRKRRTIGGPVAASPRGLRRDPAAAASPPRRSPGTARVALARLPPVAASVPAASRRPVPVPMGTPGAPVLAQGPVTSQLGGRSCQRAPREGTALGGHVQSKRGAPSPAGTPRCKAPRKAGTHPAVPPTGAGDDSGTAGLRQHCPGQGKWPRQPPSKAESGLQTPFFAVRISLGSCGAPLARQPHVGFSVSPPPAYLAPRRPAGPSSVPFPHLGFPVSVSTGGGGGMRGGRLRRPLVGEATRELWHAAVPRGDSGFFQTGSEGHYGIAAPGRPRAEPALGLASWCRPPTACPLSPCRMVVTDVSCLPPRPRARRGLRPAAGGGGAPRHPVLQHGHGAAGLHQQQLPAQRQ